MEKEFAPYEQALALKELGFDEPCLAWYGSEDIFEISGNYKNSTHTIGYCVSAPLYQQAFRWFREKYDLQCWPEVTGSNRYSCRYDGNDDIGKRYVGYLRDNLNNILFYKTYKEAELACLIKLIEIVKNK
jgi:hypothetical protein